MVKFHHYSLPDSSALLSGYAPPTPIGFQSNRLQICYFNTQKGWADPLPHAHQESDECFLVLRGKIIVDVEGECVIIGPREFCCFPRGVFHQVKEVHPPVECLVIRGPSIDDKISRHLDGTYSTGMIQDILVLLNNSTKS
jgi:Mannose-6-phosphate isomerase